MAKNFFNKTANISANSSQLQPTSSNSQNKRPLPDADDYELVEIYEYNCPIGQPGEASLPKTSILYPLVERPSKKQARKQASGGDTRPEVVDASDSTFENILLGVLRVNDERDRQNSHPATMENSNNESDLEQLRLEKQIAELYAKNEELCLQRAKNEVLTKRYQELLVMENNEEKKQLLDDAFKRIRELKLHKN